MNLHTTFMYHMILLYTCVCIRVYVRVCVHVCVCACPKEALLYQLEISKLYHKNTFFPFLQSRLRSQ